MRVCHHLSRCRVCCAADYNGVDVAVVAMCKRSGLQPTGPFVTKCLQLHETVGVRHGVMIVGQTMSGKTSVIRTLARALTSISVETKEKERLRLLAAAEAAEKVWHARSIFLHFSSVCCFICRMHVGVICGERLCRRLASCILPSPMKFAVHFSEVPYYSVVAAAFAGGRGAPSTGVRGATGSVRPLPQAASA